MTPRICVVVLAFNRYELTRRCLRSVMDLDYDNFSVLCVDNGSVDGTAASIRHDFPAVEILETGWNSGFTGWARFRKIVWPTMLRLAWPAYTNEAIFLFHATTLVFFSGFPAFQQRGDALYYANYFADKTFNPFVPYPIVAFYFICLTLTVIWLFGLMNRRLNRHLPAHRRVRIRVRPQLIR